ncbi:hypothetical protein PG996_007548 [Apiospora saccharicola]|uniref:BED-type domain-containing protein n=1 Tax=Apiospora saccharicola TaxID=335842 RepID=A0ABR1VDN5_9PEZI
MEWKSYDAYPPFTRGHLALHRKGAGKFTVPLDSNSLRRVYCLDCGESSTSSHRGMKNKHKDISCHISKHRADSAYQRDQARHPDYEWRCAYSFKAQSWNNFLAHRGSFVLPGFLVGVVHVRG